MNNTTEAAAEAPPLVPEASVTEYKAGRPQRRPTHPGEILKSAIEDAGLNANSFAPLIGKSAMHVGRLMKCEVPFSADLAVRVGTVLGNGPELWMNMQVAVDIWDARQALAGEVIKLQPLPKDA